MRRGCSARVRCSVSRTCHIQVVRGAGGREEGRENVRQLTLIHPLPILLPLPYTTPPNDEKPMMPRRIVPHILRQHRIHEIQLARPQFIFIVEVRKQPLAVRPRMVVLRIRSQRARDEIQFLRGLAGDDE